MRPNSQAYKHKSSHGTEREFGGTLGESQQTRPPLYVITIYIQCLFQDVLPPYITMNSTFLGLKIMNAESTFSSHSLLLTVCFSVHLLFCTNYCTSKVNLKWNIFKSGMQILWKYKMKSSDNSYHKKEH